MAASAAAHRRPHCSAPPTAWPSAPCAPSRSAAFTAGREIAVIGHDNLPLCRLRRPAAVEHGDRSSRYRAGELAEMLIARLGGARPASCKRILPVRQVPRATHGPPPTEPNALGLPDPGPSGRQRRDRWRKDDDASGIAPRHSRRGSPFRRDDRRAGAGNHLLFDAASPHRRGDQGPRRAAEGYPRQGHLRRRRAARPSRCA